MSYDLSIALRIYPRLSKEHFFFKSKHDLVETCLDSLIKSLNGIKYELITILDNCPQDYKESIRRRVDHNNLRIIETKGIGNASTFLSQISLLRDHANSEYVYFAEDDYYYIGKMKEMLEFSIENSDVVDFVTPYDHLDYYINLEFHGYKMNVMEYKDRMWKQVGSTTCTFMTSRKILEETSRVLKYYPLIGDYLMWNLLTRKNPVLKSTHFHKPYLFWMPFYILSYLRNTTTRKYYLWSPVKTIATHLQTKFLSPGINWYKYLLHSHDNN